MDSDSLLLLSIQKTYLFHDRKSVFKETGYVHSGLVKPKLKFHLAKNELLEQWIFIASTKSPFGCNASYTIQIKPDSWEKVYMDWIKEYPSYLCVRNIDVLTREELITKRNDLSNKFEIAAKAYEKDFETLIEMYKKSREELEKENPAIASLADFALLGVDISEYAEQALKNLNLLK